MPKRNSGPKLEWRDERQTWEIVWYERGRRRRRSTGTDDRREADRQFIAFLAEKPAGPNRPRDPSERLIADALADYGAGRGEAVADPERIGYAIKALLNFWGALKVGDINETLCQGYMAFRDQAVNTIRRELSVLRAAVNFDYEHARLTRPVHVWLPDRRESRDRWLTREEAAKLLRSARRDRRSRHHLPLFILIGLYTGQRKKAILTLRWPQVDLSRGLIDFNEPGRAQTKKRRSLIPIPRRLLTFLRYAKRRGTDLGYVVTYHGQPVDDVKHAFATACRNADLAPRPWVKVEVVKGKRVEVVLRDPTPEELEEFNANLVTPHTLKHTAITWMMQRGVPVWEVAGFFQTSVETIERTYGHHSPSYLEAARRALDGNGKRGRSKAARDGA